MLNHLGAAPAGTRALSAQGTSWLMQVLRPFSTLPPSLPGGAPSLLSPGPTSKLARFHPVRLWLLTLLALQPFLPRLHPLPHPSLGSGPSPCPSASRLHLSRLWLRPGPSSCPALTSPSPRVYRFCPLPPPSGLATISKVNFLSFVQLTSLALPSLTDSKGSLVTRGREWGSHRPDAGEPGWG